MRTRQAYSIAFAAFVKGVSGGYDIYEDSEKKYGCYCLEGRAFQVDTYLPR
jgi:hypothetical protein